MSPSNSLKTVSLVGVSVAAATVLIQACGGGSSAQAVEAAVPDPIIGIWNSDSSLKDCASGAVLGSTKGLAMFNQGGTASFDNSRSPTTHGATMGTWTHEADGSYTLTLVFMRFNPDGTLAGTQKGRGKRTISEDGKSFNGIVNGDVIDLQGNIISGYCLTVSGTRVTW